MPGEFQRNVLQVVHQVLGGTCEPTPGWLTRPGRTECGKRWKLICAIYGELTNQRLPETMPAREWRRVDCVLRVANSDPRIIEVDETQHFNRFRAATLRLYSLEIQLAFDPKAWIASSEQKTLLEKGGFAVPRPPLFPGSGGRHLQRAFRDALCDILPPDHGFLPTLRIAKFDVGNWLTTNDACGRMEELLHRKLSN
jgi:hypothetical protein